MSQKTYIANNRDRTFDAFVDSKGCVCNRSLAECLRFIREQTGKTQGAVPFFNRETCHWDSEFDLAEGGTA